MRLLLQVAILFFLLVANFIGVDINNHAYAAPKEIKDQLLADGVDENDIKKYSEYFDDSIALLLSTEGKSDAQKNYREIIEKLTLANQIYPLHTETYKLMAVAHANLGEFDKAVENYTKAIVYCKSDKDKLYRSRGFVYMMLNQFENALDDMNAACSLNPSEENIKNRDRVKASIRDIEYDESLKEENLDSISIKHYKDLMREGTKSEKNQKYGEAISYYEQATAIAPFDERPFDGIARCYYRLNQYDKLSDVIRRGGSVVKNKSKFYTNMSIIYSHASKGKEALDCINKAFASTDTPTIDMYHLRGVAYILLQNPEKALEDASTILSIDPNSDKGLGLKKAAIFMIQKLS